MYKIHLADKSTSLNLKQPEFYRLPRWLVNTEWEGKTSQYLLLRDGFVESPLKEGPIFFQPTPLGVVEDSWRQTNQDLKGIR